MAETLTEQIVGALRRAAADPAGLALTRTKQDAGLFAATPAGKAAAQKALAEGLIALMPATGLMPGHREVATLTAKGRAALAELACPKQVLEDCLRAVELRQEELKRLTQETARLGETFLSLHATVAAALCRTTATHPPTAPEPAAMPIATKTTTDADLAGVLLARLSDWGASAAAGQDCPLPELFRSLSTQQSPPTIGTFHDLLRTLARAERVALHPWTGPLYAMPEPEYALLAGHNVAYYASLRADR